MRKMFHGILRFNCNRGAITVQSACDSVSFAGLMFHAAITFAGWMFHAVERLNLTALETERGTYP
jgi:hypothetical protein